MKLLFTLLFICFLLHAPLKAQEGADYNQQLWLEALIDYPFGYKWGQWTDVSYRKINSDDLDYTRIMLRPNFKWQALKLLDVRGGVGAFYTYFTQDNATLEIRPWEGVSVTWPSFKRIRLAHLIRLEQRFIYDTSDWSYAYSNRLRYQISTRINLSKIKKYKTFFIPLAIEIFLQDDDDQENNLFRSQARYTIGLGYVVNREVTFDAKFVVERSRSDDFDLAVSDLIFRLRFRYNLFSFEEDETKL